MTTMQDTLELPDGTAATGIKVSIYKLAPTTTDEALAIGSSVTVVGVSTVTTDANGAFSVDLRPTSTLTPSGTKYQAIASSGQQIIYDQVFNVPDAGPTWIGGDLTDPPGALTNSALQTHLDNTSNPHVVTKTQVGLGNVDNTSDANKPVSTAQQTALDAKLDDTDTAWILPTLEIDITVRNAIDHKGLRVKAGVFYWHVSLNVASPGGNKALFPIPANLQVFAVGGTQHYPNTLGTSIYIDSNYMVRMTGTQSTIMSSVAIPAD